MTMELALRRRFFAEEVQAIGNLSTPALVEAFATVPREAFLRPGPWLIQGEGDIGLGPRQTPDADPRHVYHNMSVAIDAGRTLFNGGPSVVGRAIDALALQPGGRALHVGCGLGYYTALMAHCVGPQGRVLAIEVDETLATEARANLAAYPGVEVRHGDASQPIDETFTGILVNAGVTHPQAYWLDDLDDDGRLVFPLTYGFPASMPPGKTTVFGSSSASISKGFMVGLSKTSDPLALGARVLGMVAIYSAIGLRDEATNQKLGEALKRSMWPTFKRLRRDPHDASPSCWMHGDGWCLSA